MTAFDSGLFLFLPDELLDRDAGSARKPDRMAQEADGGGSGGCSRFRTAVQLTSPLNRSRSTINSPTAKTIFLTM